MESADASPLPSVPASRTSTPSTAATSSAAAAGPKQTKICVYCGSSTGKSPAYMDAARQLARVMAENNIGLVYGGGTVGLMGELAKTLVSLSGPEAVHGIIPEALVRYERDPNYTSTVKGEGPAHTNEGDLAVPAKEIFGRTTVVKDMHTRKRMMAQEVLEAGPGSGFIALTGGYGTFEELLETCTWNQLGIHDKGVCVLNVNGFYDGLFAWIRKSIEEGFIAPGQGSIIVEAKTGEEAIQKLREYKVAPSVLKLAWGKE